MYSILLHAPLFQKDYRGMAELKNIRIAVSGIYDYALEEIPTLRLPLPGQGAPEWAEKKRVYKVYRPAFVLAAACGKFKMLPLTHHHPSTPVDGRNFRKLAVGYTGENPFVDWIKDTDEVGIRSTVMIYDEEALDAYERGEIQLSPGYVASFEWRRGKAPDGQEYDIVMKEITDVNHLALLPAGRGGEYAVVMDGAGRERSVFELAKLRAETRDSRKIYQIGEISEINKAALRWTVNDDGTLTPEDKPSTGSLKKALWSAPRAQTQQQDSALNYDTEPDGKVLSNSAGGDCSKGPYGSLHDVFISDKERNDDEMKIACPEATGSSIYRSINGVGGQPQRQAGNCKYSLMHNAGSVKDEINREKATGAIAYAADFTSDTVRPENLFDTEIVIHTAPKVKSVFEIAAGINDGAPYGNDNASKDHVNKEDDGLDEKEKALLHDLLKTNAVEFPVVEFSEENYKKYLGTPIDTPIGKVKLGENQFEKLKSKNRQNLIGAIHDTLAKPCFIAEEKGGTTLYVKSFIQNDKQKNIMSVVIKRDGLNISISTHEEREPQILSKIKKAGVLRETASDDGTVHDERVADTTRVVSLNITDTAPKVKSVFEIAAGSVFDRARR